MTPIRKGRQSKIWTKKLMHLFFACPRFQILKEFLLQKFGETGPEEWRKSL
jgi:hypothetical protein